jgi:hypothetical protein
MYSHVGSHLEQMELLCCQQLDNTNGNGGLLSAHDLHAAWARLGSAEATVKATSEGYAFIKSATILMTPPPPPAEMAKTSSEQQWENLSAFLK